VRLLGPLDNFLTAAEKCAKSGYPFGMPLSTWSDAVNWVSAVFASRGASLVDEEGNIVVKSDAVKGVLEWFKKAVPFFPPSAFAWDNFLTAAENAPRRATRSACRSAPGATRSTG